MMISNRVLLAVFAVGIVIGFVAGCAIEYSLIETLKLKTMGC